MNKKIMKMLLPSLLVCMISMMVGCHVNDEEYVSLNPRIAYDSEIVYYYDGEWSVDRQVVDTARMELRENGKIEVRLPESYLLGLISLENSPAVPANRPTTIEISIQGYSEQSQYMSFNSKALKDKNEKISFSTSSFLATIGGETCIIEILSYENAAAVIQNNTGQWTLGIPIDAFLVTSQQTGQSTEYRLPSPVMLYYNTKQRIG